MSVFPLMGPTLWRFPRLFPTDGSYHVCYVSMSVFLLMGPIMCAMFLCLFPTDGPYHVC